MNTGSTLRPLVVSLFVLSGLALAACSGIPASAAALMDREALAALSGSTIDISSSRDLTVGGETEFTGAVESITGADSRPHPGAGQPLRKIAPRVGLGGAGLFTKHVTWSKMRPARGARSGICPSTNISVTTVARISTRCGR